MRQTFIETLTQLARNDKQVMLITGDLGYSVFEKFATEFPNQYVNCGIMEQAMMSIAAGLALSGKKPYVYSIIPFATMRPFEQIRNDVCYQNLNVKIVGTGTGFAYGPLGSTHYAIEDIAILRSLPNITILSPADSIETRALTLQSYKKHGPAYLRLLKPETILIPPGVKTSLSKPSVIMPGKDGVIITTGAALAMGLQVAEALMQKKRHLAVVSMHTLKPVDEKAFVTAVQNQKKIFTIEEHRVVGGLASVVAELLFKHKLHRTTLTTFGVDHTYSKTTGHQDYLAKEYGLDAQNISKKIMSLYQ